MNFRKSTSEYEDWLSHHVSLVAADIEFKHKQMSSSAFAFFRATYYRWAQLFCKLEDRIAKAPSVLAVGDLHVENFGTWVDSEGRLVWGVNDVDEATKLPYTNDLIRLACSVQLAIAGTELRVDLQQACESILAGYEENLKTQGQPFVLSDRHQWLHRLATSEDRDPEKFWDKLAAMPNASESDLGKGAPSLCSCLPSGSENPQMKRRRAGLGSLGRPRLVVIAELNGGRVAREAKAMAPSAALWAMGDTKSAVIQCRELIGKAVRCADPYLMFEAGWQIRRLAPYCSRIELSSLPKQRDEARLLRAMGWETANMHQSTPEQLEPIRKHLKHWASKSLRNAAEEMSELIESEFKEWSQD